MKILDDYQPILSCGKSIEDIVKLSSLEALQRLKDLEDLQGGRDEFFEYVKVIEKSLKALEIIKNKVQKIKWLGFVYKDGSNIFDIEYRETPTKEEIKLLEEIFK